MRVWLPPLNLEIIKNEDKKRAECKISFSTEIWLWLVLCKNLGTGKGEGRNKKGCFIYCIIIQYVDRMYSITVDQEKIVLKNDSATWYSIHTCSMLWGSTMKKMFPYNFFTLNEANACVALPNAWRRSVRARF
jgi:hypothetical protein